MRSIYFIFLLFMLANWATEPAVSEEPSQLEQLETIMHEHPNLFGVREEEIGDLIAELTALDPVVRGDRINEIYTFADVRDRPDYYGIPAASADRYFQYLEALPPMAFEEHLGMLDIKSYSRWELEQEVLTQEEFDAEFYQSNERLVYNLWAGFLEDFENNYDPDKPIDAATAIDRLVGQMTPFLYERAAIYNHLDQLPTDFQPFNIDEEARPSQVCLSSYEQSRDLKIGSILLHGREISGELPADTLYAVSFWAGDYVSLFEIPTGHDLHAGITESLSVEDQTGHSWTLRPHDASCANDNVRSNHTFE